MSCPLLECNPNWPVGQHKSLVLTYKCCKCAIKFICTTSGGRHMDVHGPPSHNPDKVRLFLQKPAQSFGRVEGMEIRVGKCSARI